MRLSETSHYRKSETFDAALVWRGGGPLYNIVRMDGFWSPELIAYGDQDSIQVEEGALRMIFRHVFVARKTIDYSGVEYPGRRRLKEKNDIQLNDDEIDVDREFGEMGDVNAIRCGESADELARRLGEELPNLREVRGGERNTSICSGIE